MQKKIEPFDVCELIRLSREKLYRTAKEFHSANEDNLQTSYSHYAAVEGSKKFPDIELTLRIAKTLKLEPRLVSHLWARDQMPDAATKAFFEPRPGSETGGVPSALRYDLDNFFIFNERQIEELKRRPEAWEVLMFIMAFSKSTPPTEEEVARVLGFDRAVVTECVEWLRNESAVISEGGHLKTRTEFFHLPNTEPFKEVRDRNFRRMTDHLLKTISSEQLGQKTAYRTTFIRRLTPVQATELSRKIDDLIAQMGNFENHGESLYALTVGFGERAFFKKKQKSKSEEKSNDVGCNKSLSG
ncbi:MAG: hypothetical protein IT285_06740 [Bdellovibrionales bacterium]|nr:hypothetical protein [Bdellovibrionales bacterium]